MGVLNTYSMFISALIHSAKPGALIGVIALDSFLTSRGHAPLRKQITSQCAIHRLLLCPNDLFRSQGADVRTCIMILEKNGDQHQPIQILDRLPNTTAFRDALEKNSFASTSMESLLLNGEKDDGEFVIDLPHDVRELFSYARLCDTFPCVTGISTGDDSTYLSRVPTPGFSTPFYKNPGRGRFFAPPNAYLRDDFLAVEKTAKTFMVRNKNLLYREGIICSSMGASFSACYLPSNSTWGVNTAIMCPQTDLWWLLAYLNSPLVTFMVRGVLNRSNMVTSGYVSRIPVPHLSKQARLQLARIAQSTYSALEQNDKSSSATLSNALAEVTEITSKEYALSASTTSRITDFGRNILKRL